MQEPMDLIALAERPFDKARYPEAPYQVHAERARLARWVLGLSAQQVDDQQRAAKARMALQADLRVAQRLLQRSTAGLQLSQRTVRALEKRVGALEKALQRARKGGAGAGRLSSQPGRRKGAPGPAGARKACKVPGCTSPGMWGLACPRHLKGLPGALKRQLQARVPGRQGRPSSEWSVAAQKALAILRRVAA